MRSPLGFQAESTVKDRVGSRSVTPGRIAVSTAQMRNAAVAYEPMPIIPVSIEKLALDLDNYRIPTHSADEAAAMKYLFASEDVLEAARLIIRDGYFDNEVPIVVADADKYVVLEGNRRVCALKALKEPGIEPDHEGDVRALLKRFAVEAENLPDEIRVFVAPDRGFAAPHVARLHTGVPKRRWTRDQQANYYFALLGPTTNVEDVKAAYPDVDVVRFIRMAVVRRMLSKAPFKDHSLRLYAASSADLRMSSFEYAYRNKDIAEAIGVSFDRDGFLLPRAKTAEQIGAALDGQTLEALEYLLGRFRAEELNTRSPEFRKDTPEHADLVSRLLGVVDPNASSSDAAADVGPADPAPGGLAGEDEVDSEDVQGEEASSPDPGQDQDGTPPASRSRGPNHPATKDKLDLSGIDYSGLPVNLKERYFELRKISVKELPAATAMLLRSILEITTKHHFGQAGAAQSGDLGEVFKSVTAAYSSVKSLKAPINAIQSGGVNKPGSLQWFNVVAHSADIVVTSDDVRNAWKAINPVLRRLLQAP